MARKALHAVRWTPEPSMSTQRVGWFVGWSERDEALVDFQGNGAGPLVARSTVALPERDAASAIDDPPEVVLMIEDQSPERPIIVGLVRAPRRPKPAATPDVPSIPGPLELSVDGRRVTLAANDEIVLSCGKASITLRRNGRLILRGTYVETSSEGVNRITGGSVEIN
jgi:Domain of unknown function (DUF6484)